MRVILDIGGSLAIVISACTVVLYTLLGGLYSVAYTDVIQLVFITLSLASPGRFFVTSFLTKGRNPALLFSMSQTKITPPILALALQFLFGRTGLLKGFPVLMRFRQCSHKVLALLGERGCSQTRSAELVYRLTILVMP